MGAAEALPLLLEEAAVAGAAPRVAACWEGLPGLQARIGAFAVRPHTDALQVHGECIHAVGNDLTAKPEVPAQKM